MPRQPTGSVRRDSEGRWVARIRYADEAGKRCGVRRIVKTEAEGRRFLKTWLREFEDHGARSVGSAGMTFADLAGEYAKTYLVEAQYHEGRKVAGLRSYKDGLLHLKPLQSHFGRKRLRDLTYAQIEAYRALRLRTPRQKGRDSQGNPLPRTIASVNRELSLLRNMFNVAVREGWLPRNPFTTGKPLINAADEKKRQRILSRAEEARMLAACVGPRAHLRPLIIAALDSGCRQGELFSLEWSDVDLDAGVLRIRAMNTKTLTGREVPITTRLAAEFETLRLIPRPDDRVFGISDNVSKAFTAVRKTTGLADVRFHDLRHTAATRLVQGGLALAEVARILGHTNISTTFRYTNADNTTLRRAAAILDGFHAEADTRADASRVN